MRLIHAGDRASALAVLVSLLVIMVSAGCGGALPESRSQEPSALPKEVAAQIASQPVPLWVASHQDSRYPDRVYLTGVGESSSGFPEAEAQARLDLAKRIEVQIEGKDSFVALESTEGGYRYSVKSDVAETVSIQLSGLTTADRWVDSTGRRYFAFAILSREKAAATVRTDLDMLLDQARMLTAKARELEEQQEPLRALASYGRLQAFLGDIHALRKRYQVLRGDLPESRPLAAVPSAVDIDQRLDDLLASIRLLPVSGEGQYAVIGKPLDQPLAVKLVSRRGGTDIPVRDLSILFAFEKGQGQVEQMKRTDGSGQAQTMVREVRPTEETASVVARLDVDALTNGLPANLRRRAADKLGQQVVPFMVVPPRAMKPSDPWMQAIGQLSESLLSQFDEKGKPSVAVLDFLETYESKRLPVSRRLETDLRTALSNYDFVSLVQKEIPVSAATKDEKARVLGVGLYVDGHYVLSSDALKVNATLNKPADGTIKAAASVSIPRGLLTSRDLQGFKESVEQTPSTALSAPASMPLSYDQLLARLVMLQQPTPPFRIRLWTEKPNYAIGDKVTFFFESEQDCYLTLVDIGTSGRLTVLFPNQYEKNNFVPRGRRVAIPEPHYGFDIAVGGPTGVERVKAIVTTEPFTLFESMNFSNGFFGLNRGDSVRDFKVSLKNVEPNQWTDASIEVLILERGRTEPRGRGLLRDAKGQRP